MKMIPLGKFLLSSLLLATISLPQTLPAAPTTWLGAGTDDLWNSAGNWDVTPVSGDTLIFDGVSRLINTNDITFTGVAGIRFNTGGFVLKGNGLTLTTSAITNSVGTNEIRLGINWGLAGNLHIASGTELIISGVLTNPFAAGSSNVVYKGGGRVRYTGGYLQESNNPATIINSAEVVVDGGTFSSGGGTRIASDPSAGNSKIILTNGAVMNQSIAAGAIRVGDLAGITGELQIHSSTLIHSGGNVLIPNAASSIGVITQNGGLVTNADIAFCNAATTVGTYNMVGGVLAPTRIRKVNAGSSATITFDGSTLRPGDGFNTAFFTGLNTAEVKSGGLTINSSGETFTIGQSFTGAGKITKSGTGTVTFSATNLNNSFTVTAGTAVLSVTNLFPGGVTVTGGTLQIGTNNAVGNATLSLNGGTIRSTAAATARTISVPVSLGGNVTYSTSDLTFTGTHTLTSNRTVTVNNTNFITGVIGDGGSGFGLTKAGTGILVLSNANTYSSLTTVSAGTLRVNNGSGSATGSGNVSISAAGTLAGTGTISGSVTNAGVISPGASSGTLATGPEVWTSGGSYKWEINDAIGTAGGATGWDKLAIAGTLNITATPSSKFTINITSLAGAVAGSAANFNNATDYTWVIATASGGIAGFDTDAFVLSGNSFSNALGSGNFNIAVSGNDLVIKFVHPPTITTHPQSVTTNVFENVTFTVGSDATTFQWRKNGVSISGATDSSLTLTSVDESNSGSYDVVLGNASGTIVSTAATLTVLKMEQTIDFQALGNKTYSDADFGVSATASSGLPVSFSIFSGPATILSGTNVHLTGAGTVVVRASQAGNAQTNAATPVDQSFLVSKGSLLVTAINTNTYGTIVLTPTYVGFLNADTAGTSLTGAPELTTAATTNSPVSFAPYVITVGLGTLASANYDLSTSDGTLMIAPASLTVTAANTNRVYGAANPAFVAGYSGFMNGEDVSFISGSPVLSTTADTNSPVGNHTITVTIGTLVATNYAFNLVDGMIAITPAALTINVNSDSRDYGSANPVFTGSLVGLQNNDNVTADYTSAANAASVVGPYPITAILNDPNTRLGNYSVTTNGGVLTISSVSLSVTADNKLRGVSEANPTFTGVINGIKNLDDITATYSTVADTLSPTGNYAIIPTLVDPGSKLGNYNVSTNHGVLEVIDVPIITSQPTNVAAGFLDSVAFNVTATGGGTLTYQWRYNTTNLGDGGIITGANSATLTLTGVTGANEGNYDVIVSNEVGSVTSSNATLTLVGGVTITNQPASLGALDQGDSATFSVGAAGGALTYQWYFGAAPISGATDSSYTRTNVQQSDAGVGFTVVVSNPGGSVTSAPPATILAVIADNEIPKVTVTTPGKKKGTNSSTITITGVAKDTGSGIIRDMKYILNEGAQSSVVSLSEIKPGQWSFASAVETLNAGVNTLSLWALDLAGNPSLTNTFEFYYDTTNDLVLHIEGQGNVKMGTSVYSGATTLLTNTFKVGRSYKLDAFVGKGTNYIFTNWVTEPNDLGSSTNKWVQKSSLTFIMQSNMVITAKFNANPFTPVAGTYNGLFSETGGITHETAGFIQVKAKDKATYSGFLLFGGVKRPFSGKFLTDGTATGLVIRTKTTNQPPVNLAFALDLTPGETISGTVSATNGAWSSTITADKAVFSLSNPETNNLGSYTLQIPTSPGAPTSSPGGVGYSTVTNNPLGVAKFGGYLSDNQKITLSMNLTRDGHVPFYVGLYKTAAPKDFRGSLMGWLTFTNGEFGLGSDNVLTWIKQGNSEATAQYAAGFSNSVEVAGSKYVAPAPGIVPVKTGDYVIVSEGNLTDPVTNVVTAVAPTATGTKVTLSKTNTLGVENKATITFKAKDGTVTGGFNNPADKTKTQGIWLQNTTNVSGYFLKTGHTESGTFRVEQIIP